MLNASRRAGYGNEEVFAAGLAVRGREGRIYDVFRGKVMFPLADRRGRVRGFGARAMRDGQGPKYVNTREGEVFSKGRQLFGIDVARAAAAKAGSVVLAEGYTDVIALHQAGFGNAVGVMGTALTGEQAREIGGLASVVLLCLDADAAGQQAAVRAASVLPDRLELRVVGMPAGSDPADVVGEEGGAERMRGLLEGAVPFARFQIERTLERARDDEALSEVARRHPLAAAGHPARRARPARLQPPRDHAGARRERGRGRPRPGRAPGRGDGAAPSRPSNGARQALDRREQSERAFLALCVALPELGEEKLAAADLDAVFSSPLARLAAERCAATSRTRPRSSPRTPELAGLSPSSSSAPASLDATPATLELEALQLDLHRLDREITAARTGGEGAIGALATERQKVLDAIRHRLQ